jgi:hypothetical protein
MQHRGRLESLPTEVYNSSSREEPMGSTRSFRIVSFLWSVVLVAVASTSLYLSYVFIIGPRQAMLAQIAEQKKAISRLEQENERLATYLKLLKHFERRARIEVLRRAPDAKGILLTTIRITEIDNTGKPLNAAREMSLPGEEFFFDTLVIKFEDHFIEKDDPFKGRALMIFRRVYSNTMKPQDGIDMDVEGQSPQVYAEQKAPNEFERNLWKRFWELANNEDLARKEGVRAVHGDAPYMRLEPGKVYEIHLRSSGEVVITPGFSYPPTEKKRI